MYLEIYLAILTACLFLSWLFLLLDLISTLPSACSPLSSPLPPKAICQHLRMHVCFKHKYFSFLRKALRVSDTLTHLAQSVCKTPEAFKAWSQNLGHESVLTTLYSYGEVNRQRQAEIMSQTFTTGSNSVDINQELVRKVFEALQPEVSRMFSTN